MNGGRTHRVTEGLYKSWYDHSGTGHFAGAHRGNWIHDGVRTDKVAPWINTVNSGSGVYLEAYHPDGEDGALRGIGSVAVSLTQWYFQRAGKCTSSCHFLET